ncbi:hypothetical protein C8Q74DRAFT_1441529 [Fomes fomentarius]|nr:hypothetical protein C8Q74DRAFT_1441529 [Fomes fomentarius]
MEGQLTELLHQLEGGMGFLSNKKIWSIHDALVRAAVHLRTAHNARQPLFSLPVEVLSRILAEIPGSCTRWPCVTTFWRSSGLDSGMLLPVSQTCRHLREIALNHHALWANIDLSKPRFVPALLQRSQHVPLVLAGSSMRDILPALDIVNGQSPRIRELILCGTREEHIDHIWELLEHPLPTLESFHLQGFLIVYRKPDSLPFTPNTTPRLRRLFLKDTPFLIKTGFPNMTHLALSGIALSNVHDRIARILSRCPRLESVVLDDLLSETIPDAAVIKAPLPLEHLRRVTLHELPSKAHQYYQALLQPRGHDTSYHLLGYFGVQAVPLNFFPSSSQTPVQLSVSLHPSRTGNFLSYEHAVAITLTTEETTRRLATYGGHLRDNAYSSPLWIGQVVPTLASLDIREAWLLNASAAYPRPRREAATAPPASSATLLEGLSTLESVVIIVDHTYNVIKRKPRLNLLPSSRDPAFKMPHLSTVRIVHGYSDHSLALRFAEERGYGTEPENDVLDLTPLLEDFASGEYDYIKHLLLQTTPQLEVEETQLERLRMLVPSVRFERIDQLPSMPLRGEDPERTLKECAHWPGSIW